MQGRILLPQQPPGSLKVGFSERTVTLETSLSSSAALERSARRDYGRIMTPTPALVILCTKGELSVSFDKKQESVAALDVLALDAGGVRRVTEDKLPAWATDAEPSPHELQLRDQFTRMIHPDRPVVADLVVASEDESPDIKRSVDSGTQAPGRCRRSSKCPCSPPRRAIRSRDEVALAAIRSLHAGLGSRRREPCSRSTRGGVRKRGDRFVRRQNADRLFAGIASNTQIDDQLVGSALTRAGVDRRSRAGSRHIETTDRARRPRIRSRPCRRQGAEHLERPSTPSKLRFSVFRAQGEVKASKSGFVLVAALP